MIAMRDDSLGEGGGCLSIILPAAGSITPDSKPVSSASRRSWKVAHALGRRSKEFRAVEMLSSCH